MEISNQNLSNHVITILNTLNENINNLGESLKNVSIDGEKDETVNKESKLAEGETNDTKGSVECSNDLNQEHVTMEIQSIYEAAKTMQKLDRKTK